MSDENDTIRLRSSSRSITIYKDRKIESFYHASAYPMAPYLVSREGEVPEEEFKELNALLEDVEEAEEREEDKDLLDLLNPINWNWLSPRYEVKKGDKRYVWDGKGPEELGEAVNEIDRLAMDYTS